MVTMYIINCKKDLREELRDIIGKDIIFSVGFDKWNNALMLEEINSQSKTK